VVADRQTAGRGQIGSSWITEPSQNLTCSVILYPRFLAARNQFLLNQISSLAVQRLAASLVQVPVYIKWPNDVIADDRKICGILIQNGLKRDHLQYSVMGIGLNINQTRFPDELQRAASLRFFTDQDLDVMAVLAGLCEALERLYLQLRAGATEQIRRAYLDQLYLRGQLARFQRPNGQQFDGQITGVSAHGQLQVVHANGQEEFDFKAIRLLHRAY